MRIDTNEWIPIREAWPATGMSASAARRLARDMGLLETFFGVPVIRRRDIETLRANRRLPGNPVWRADGDAAAEDSLKATAARMAKKKGAPRP